MNWSGRKKLTYANEEWGQKDVEFEKIITVPSFVPEMQFNAVINRPLNVESTFDKASLKNYSWNILDPEETVGDIDKYKNFIQNSSAEFSVAKETYVKSNSGWFSCRSACYLASARPVITQETGWSKFIPAGKGLLTFTDTETAIDCLRKVHSDMAYHSKAARGIAEEFFDSNIVLKKMLEEIK
jgi:hypothetical protein